MEVKVLYKSQFVPTDELPCLVIPLFDEPLGAFSTLLERADASALERLCERDLISGKAQEVFLLPTPLSPFRNVILLGLGARDAFHAETLRRAAGKACAIFAQNRIARVVFDASLIGDLPLNAFAEGVVLGQYSYDEFKSNAPQATPKVVVDEVIFLCDVAADVSAVRRECERSLAACESANWARDLASMPPNDLTPNRLAELAKAMSKESGLAWEDLDETRMAKLGMNAILGVARGSEQRANLMILRYEHPEAKRTLAIVGKGVTFDTGGISIKPSDAMHEMKYDMCGAAAALGAIRAIAVLKPVVNVIVVVPAVENMPGANAQRPGDIVKAYNGKTIEVLNTDAEGRLILADALAYTVDKFKPDFVVDLATLTGACVVALGHYAAGVMANDDPLFASLQRAGDASGDRVWRLPLWEDYDKLIEGTHADLANIGPRGEAGAIIGGCFLKHFVGDTPWAHIDIAGAAWGAKNISYLRDKDASGYGVRLLSQWVLNEAEATA